MSNDTYDVMYELAPEGQIYVCAACGKQSPTGSGHDASGKRVVKGSWDESCMLHAVLCYAKPRPDGSWTAVPKEVL